MLLTRDLQNSRNCLIVILQNMTHIIGYMLINEDYSNIVTLRECFQCGLDNFGFGVLFDGKKIARVGCSVTYSGEEESSDGVLVCAEWIWNDEDRR